MAAKNARHSRSQVLAEGLIWHARIENLQLIKVDHDSDTKKNRSLQLQKNTPAEAASSMAPRGPEAYHFWMYALLTLILLKVLAPPPLEASPLLKIK